MWDKSGPHANVATGRASVSLGYIIKVSLYKKYKLPLATLCPILLHYILNMSFIKIKGTLRRAEEFAGGRFETF